MKKTQIKFSVKRVALLFFALLAFYSCEKENDKLEGDSQEKLMDGNVNLLDKGRYGAAEMSEEYLKNIKVVSPEEYSSKIAQFRPGLTASAQKSALTARAPLIKNLPTPPVGNQGIEGSCVGWGVGYAAHSITRFINNAAVHRNDWDSASRSAAYIYNQIKLAGDCSEGSLPPDAMNLIQNQGECSNVQMPYVDGDCATQPTAEQNIWAAASRSNGWFNVNARSVRDIKFFLSQDNAVAAAFDVNDSFYDIRNNDHVWSRLYGDRLSGHCVCIVGYNDATRLFKVMNSWGADWGRHGFFYVTYDNVTNGAFNWAGCITPNA